MDNFSLRSSQEETYVKALEVDVLFDQNPIFNLQVTAISPPSSFFHLQPSTLPIFRLLIFLSSFDALHLFPTFFICLSSFPVVFLSPSVFSSSIFLHFFNLFLLLFPSLCSLPIYFHLSSLLLLSSVHCSFVFSSVPSSLLLASFALSSAFSNYLPYNSCLISFLHPLFFFSSLLLHCIFLHYYFLITLPLSITNVSKKRL